MSGYFSVKNFEKFQHYKDRSPPWIRLYNSLLDDYDYGRLPDASKAHLNAIWLLASRYDNKIPFDSEWVARRINATSPVDLPLLAASGFIVPDHDCSEALAERKQVAMPEGEGETEAETEDSFKARARAGERPSDSGWRFEFENVFWPDYPNKVGRPAALQAYIRARNRSGKDEIMEGLRRYAANKPPDRDWMNPAKFLDEERYHDQPASPAKQRSQNGFAALALELAGEASAGPGDGPDDAEPGVLHARQPDDAGGAYEVDFGGGAGTHPPPRRRA